MFLYKEFIDNGLFMYKVHFFVSIWSCLRKKPFVHCQVQGERVDLNIHESSKMLVIIIFDLVSNQTDTPNTGQANIDIKSTPAWQIT